jgi:hypothetical protein
MDSEKLDGLDLEESITDRIAARKLAIDTAMRGDCICGALFTIEALAHENGVGFVATTALDYSDDDDSVRPY